MDTAESEVEAAVYTLDDEDFQYDYGKKDVMLDLLQKKLGKSREKLNHIFLGL